MLTDRTPSRILRCDRVEANRGHTPGHRQCPACEGSRQAFMFEQIHGEHTFLEAFPLWLATRSRLEPRSRKDYERYARRIGAWLGAARLHEIHIGMLCEWQALRRAGDP